MQYLSAGADLSDCGTYRYDLLRRWDDGGEYGANAVRRCLFVMLNPSTADGRADDPTIRRCVGFARGWGYGGLAVVNLFALRATDPRELYKHPDPVGPQNYEYLRLWATVCDLAVAAWGCHGGHRGRDAAVRGHFAEFGVKLHHLGLTKDGHPRHPLYLPKGAKPEAWA